MASFLRSSQIRAELASIQGLVASLLPDDIVSRIGLQSRIRALSNELGTLEEGNETLASTALYFGGAPVIGSMGIDAQFASKVIMRYQELVGDIWANPDLEAVEGSPVADQGPPHLHVTALLHGSIGFLIEEIEPRAVPLFPTPLKKAVEQADDLIISLASTSDEGFEQQIESLAPPAFNSVRHFFTALHRAEASIRVVNATHDATLYTSDVDRAFVRLEDSSVVERDIVENGLLVGIIPHGGRFEFQRENGELISGKVAPTLSEAYLRRLETEQAIGRRWKATITRREVKRFNRIRESYKLVDLQEAS